MNEKALLKIQMNTTFIYIICLIVSLLLTYDEYLKKDNKKLFDKTKNIALTNRIVILVLSFSYLYINIKNRELAKTNNSDLKFFNLQISASTLSLIGAFIVLYVVYKSGDYPIVSSEDPNL